jgi:molecular chaperone GrpE
VSDDSTTEAERDSTPNEAEAQTAASSDAADADPVAAARAEAQRFREQLLRTAADFDNHKKRSRREMDDAERRAREELLRDLLPVFDNLERAAQHAGQASDMKSLADGISMVLRMFTDTLGRIGIERIQAVGEPFDPALHEAVQQLETSEYPPGSVAAEVQPGYRFGERLVRPAMVVVAKPPPN